MEVHPPAAFCRSTLCELCGMEAGLFCNADEAVLCWTCDARVHAANFLVARHARTLLCQSCGAHTTRLETGAYIRPPNSPPSCTACAPSSSSQSDASLSATSSSSSSSSSDTSDKRFCLGRDKRHRIRVSQGRLHTHSAACSSTPPTEDWESQDSASSAPRTKRRV